jgi:hypothetical protein
MFFQDGCQNTITICHVSGHTHFSLDTTTEFSQWQRPLSGVHFIMGVKSAQADEGGGARPTLFTLSTITYKVVVYAPAKRTDTLLLFLLYSHMYSVVTTFKPVLKF